MSPNVTFQAKSHGGKQLPGWLLFDKTDGIFMGIPTGGDTGTVRITVRAVKISGPVSYEFTLSVKDLNGADDPERCSSSKHNTLLTLLVDRTVEDIEPHQRVMAVNNIAKFFGIPYVSSDFIRATDPSELSEEAFAC